VQDRGRRRGARLAPVADARQRRHPYRQQPPRRLHVDDLGRARVPARPRPSHHQDGALIDGRRLHPRVVVLGPVKHGHGALEGVRVRRVLEEGAAEGRRDDRRLHEGRVEERALEVQEAGVGQQRVAKGPDGPTIRRRPVRQRADVVGHGASVGGHGLRVRQRTGVEQLGQDGGQAAGDKVVLAQHLAGRQSC